MKKKSAASRPMFCILESNPDSNLYCNLDSNDINPNKNLDSNPEITLNVTSTVN